VKGDRGAGAREKRGGAREAGEEGWEAGETEENYAKLRNISQYKKYKEVGANKNMAGTGIKRYGKREV